MASKAPFERLPSIAAASQMPIDSSSSLLSSAPPAFIFRATTRVPRETAVADAQLMVDRDGVRGGRRGDGNGRSQRGAFRREQAAECGVVVARVAAVERQQRHALIVDDVDRDIQVAPEIEQPGPRMAFHHCPEIDDFMAAGRL
jgi:hypothetical protein